MEDPSEYVGEGSSEILSDAVGRRGDARPRPNPNDGIDFVREMVIKIYNVIATQNCPREKYDALTIEQYEAIKSAGVMFLAVFQENMGLGPRPNQISLP